MARYYLAVDGGGSSTEFLLTNSSSEALICFKVGPTSKKSIGAQGARANIAEGVLLLTERLEALGDDDGGYGRRDGSSGYDGGTRIRDVRGIWGLSGCDTAADQAEYEQMLVSAGLDLAYHRVVNDSLLALRSCVPGPGIVLVAGTGSVCVGVGATGETVRLGGWGYQTSDLGSGTWVGSQLLREALLFDDGCRPDDPAFTRVYQMAGCAAGELGPVSAQLKGADQIAAFARIVMENPESPVCAAISDQAAAYLAGYVRSVASRLFPDAPYDVVLAGGLFKSEAFAQRVSASLDSKARTHLPSVSPARGGIDLLVREDRA